MLLLLVLVLLVLLVPLPPMGRRGVVEDADAEALVWVGVVVRVVDVVAKFEGPEGPDGDLAVKAESLPMLALLVPRSRVEGGGLAVYEPPSPILRVGVAVPRLGPMTCGKRDGFAAFAALLNAPIHCMTCVGSLPS